MPRRLRQFSLRGFLLATVVLGPILGVCGPPVWRMIWEWSPMAPPQRPRPPALPEPADYPSDGYFESGETPLG